MVNWSAEKDLTLLLGILEFNNVTTTGKILDYLAGKIGEGCTAKAVSHRLTNLKTKAKASYEAAGFGDSPGGSETTPAKPTPKRSRKKKVSEDTAADGEETPTKVKAKRGRPKAESGKEDDGAAVNKKIKTESEVALDGLEVGLEEADDENLA